ncbi:phosphohydrolase [Rhodococcus sp. SRB_17]|nr:phosphohydrolase [Rhodococcus sp. SRB_17]
MHDLPTPTDASASELLVDNAPYLRAVTDLADKCRVVTRGAIYSHSGIKLVDQGTRIDSRLYERLVQHKLREPIDTHLVAEDMVDHAALVAAGRGVAQQPLPQLLVRALGSPARLLAPLPLIPLPAPLAFRLTVMREQRPDLYQHSLQMMMVAVFLGVQSGMDERGCVPLATAALLHDVGVLHMEPAWQDPQHKVVGAGRKHLVAHPVTAMLVLRAAQVYPRPVELAVLEHHERMDGTGYPRGLQGADISPLGRILLLAEVVAAFYEKYPDMPAQQLSLMLRLNHRKFPSDLVAHVLPLLQQPAHAADRGAGLEPVGADAARHIEALASAFGQWERAKGALPGLSPSDPDSALAFVEGRLRALQKVLVEAGAHPDQQSQWLEPLQGDTAGLAEVAFVGREALWQLKTIVNASQRRWPAVMERQHPADAAVADWCDWVTQRL